MNKEKTGNLIREQRMNKGLTQEELAKLISVSNKAVSRWETGASFPDVGLLDALAKELGISIEELVLGEKKESVPSDVAMKELVAEVRHQQSRRGKKLINAALYITLALVVLCVILLVFFCCVALFLNSEPNLEEAKFTAAIVIALVLLALMTYGVPGLGLFISGILLNNGKPKRKITRVILYGILILSIVGLVFAGNITCQVFGFGL